MAEVQIADGHNNTAGYDTFNVEPWTPVIQPGIYRVSLSNGIAEDGKKSSVLRWQPKVPDSVNQDIRSKAGLTSALTNLVTVSLPTNANRSTFQDYNATAVLFEEGVDFQFGGWRGLEIQLLFLEAI